MIFRAPSTLALDDVAVAYRRHGAAPTPIVLLHGLLGSGATWAPVADRIEGELDVVLPDARGHGASKASGGGYRYADLAGDVTGLITGLDLDRPILLGHSMGGLTAALVAATSGHLLRGLVLVDPTFLPPDRQREVYESDVAGQHAPAVAAGRAALIDDARVRHPKRPAELVELQVDARLGTDPAAFDILRPPNPPYRDLVDAVDVPTLLVIGDRTVVTRPMADDLRDRNPHVRIEQFDDAAHGLPFDHPERLARSILRFARDVAITT